MSISPKLMNDSFDVIEKRKEVRHWSPFIFLKIKNTQLNVTKIISPRKNAHTSLVLNVCLPSRSHCPKTTRNTWLRLLISIFLLSPYILIAAFNGPRDSQCAKSDYYQSINPFISFCSYRYFS